MVPILAYAQHYKKYYTAQFACAAAAYGLNQLEIDILLFLHNNPELCTASDICRYRGLAKSNVSAAVERLRSRGVLEVLPAPDNRRQRILRVPGWPARWLRHWLKSNAARWSRCLTALPQPSSRPCRSTSAAWTQIFSAS